MAGLPSAGTLLNNGAVAIDERLRRTAKPQAAISCNPTSDLGLPIAVHAIRRDLVRLSSAAFRRPARHPARRLAGLSAAVRTDQSGDREARLAQHVLPLRCQVRVSPDEPGGSWFSR